MSTKERMLEAISATFAKMRHTHGSQMDAEIEITEAYAAICDEAVLLAKIELLNYLDRQTADGIYVAISRLRHGFQSQLDSLNSLEDKKP